MNSITKPWFPRGVLGKIAMGLGSSAVDLVSEYALKKHLNVLTSRIDLGKEKKYELLDVEITELEDVYRDLLGRYVIQCLRSFALLAL